MSAREEVLRRVRAALGPARTAADDAVPRAYADAPAVGDVLDLFAERVADYRATVTRVTPDDLAGAVAAALAAREVGRLVVPAALPGEWLAGARDLEVLRDEPPLSVDALDGTDGVLTGAAVGIALTGTIVLDGGPDQGRRALTLVPDYHLCVVRADQVVTSVPQAVRRLDPRRPLTWVSGPSATSDIELDRVEGVHGPRTLEVLLVAPPTG